MAKSRPAIVGDRWGETRVAYAICHSARRKKTVAVTVDPTGSVLLVAPEHLTTRRLDAIVSRKAEWIVRRIRRAEAHGPPLSPREFVSGESVRYLGRHYRLKVHLRKPPKHRAWRKLHVAVDADTGEIVASDLTSRRTRDGARAPTLLGQIDRRVASVSADGAYDTGRVYEAAHAKGEGRAVRVRIPPGRNAQLSPRPSAALKERNRNVRSIRRLGRREWPTRSGYSRRAMVGRLPDVEVGVPCEMPRLDFAVRSRCHHHASPWSGPRSPARPAAESRPRAARPVARSSRPPPARRQAVPVPDSPTTPGSTRPGPAAAPARSPARARVGHRRARRAAASRGRCGRCPAGWPSRRHSRRRVSIAVFFRARQRAFDRPGMDCGTEAVGDLLRQGGRPHGCLLRSRLVEEGHHRAGELVPPARATLLGHQPRQTALLKRAMCGIERRPRDVIRRRRRHSTAHGTSPPSRSWTCP